MEWSFDSPGGAVTVRREGDQAICQAIRASDGGGLYKAWLHGEEKRVLLGTLIPEGGALRLRRALPIAQLERRGVWPPVGAEILPTEPAGEIRPPVGWSWVDCPGRLMRDPAAAVAGRKLTRALLRRYENGFELAFPFNPAESFPLAPLFCLGRLERLDRVWHILFSFSSRGCPELPHSGGTFGETKRES
ncbi:MAG: hypothetical protein VB096_10785 [Pseudoflavonifractor sp.]|nr:hypothetical protein [Pseudoflavonifractor sp.]